MRLTRVLAMMAFAVLLSLPAMAQEGAPADGQAAQAQAGGRPPDRIIRPMRAVDPMTLKAEGVSIRLWGIRPAQTMETPLEIKALDLMDALISEQQVNCKIVGGRLPELVGRCLTQENEDLALSLLAEGYAVVDRRQTFNSVFATNYEKVQEQARLNSRGVWRYVNEPEAYADAPPWLKNNMDIFPVALIAGPFFGLLLVGLLMFAGLRRIAARAERGQEEVFRKEEGLQSRERQVLISTLEGELQENKNKIEAFLAIYGDMLRGLRDGTETPKYQQVGDIVQKHPSYSKTVFEANVGKLSLLDIKLAGHVSKLYAAMPGEQEYVNLETHIPIDTAVRLVEKVLAEARGVLPGIEQVIAELQAAQAA